MSRPFEGRRARPNPPHQTMNQSQMDNYTPTHGSQPPANQISAQQQAAFQHNAQLPSSNTNANVLDGVSPEQVAYIVSLLQSGQLPMLPPAAPLASQPNHVQQAAAPPPDNAQVQMQDAPTPSQNHGQDTDMDKEEGELEEGEAVEVQQERGFLRPPPTGPRDRVPSPRSPQLRYSAQPASTSTSTTNEGSMRANQPQSNGAVSSRVDREASAQLFVREMVNAGKTFDDLAREVTHPKALVRLFRRLGLQVPGDRNSDQTAQRPNGTTSTQTAQALPPKPALNEISKASVVRRQPPSTKPETVDRSQYLAKLAAVRKKPETASVESVPLPPQVAPADNPSKPAEEPAEPTEIPAEPAETRTQNSLSDAVVDKIQPPPAIVDRAELNRRIRQRMEALQIQQAAQQTGISQAQSSPIPLTASLPEAPQKTASSPGPPTRATGTTTDIDARFAQLRSQQPSAPPKAMQAPAEQPKAVQSVFTPPPPTPTNTFAGLPGLFMNSAATQVSQPLAQDTFAPPEPLAQPVVSTMPQLFAAPTTTSRKRPVASDFEDSSKASASKRPFGQSRNGSENESMIIEVSDDEDEDDEMDISPTVEVPESGSKIQTKSFRDGPPLHNLPPKPNFQMQSSAPSTPGNTTPGKVYLEQHLQEMENLKRRIAERESKKKANGNTVSTHAKETAVHIASSILASPGIAENSFARPDGQSTPKIAGIAISPGRAVDTAVISAGSPIQHSAHSRTTSTNQLASSAASRGGQEQEVLRQRLWELERDEVADIDEAVQAASSPYEPDTKSMPQQVSALASNLPGTGHGDATTVSATSASQDALEQSRSIAAVGDAEAEEGQIDDGSTSEFYDDDKQDIMNQTGVPEAINHTDQASSTEVQVVDTFSDDQDDEMVDSLDEPSAINGVPEMPNQAVHNIEDEEVESDFDYNDLDTVRGPIATQAKSNPATESVQMHSSAENADSTSDASDDSDEYEPSADDAPSPPVGQPQGKVTADLTVIEADDELASELQPTSDRVAELETAVSQAAGRPEQSLTTCIRKSLLAGLTTLHTRVLLVCLRTSDTTQATPTPCREGSSP